MVRSDVCDGGVGQRTCTISSYTAAVESVESEVNPAVVLLKQRPTGVSTKPTTVLGGIVGTECIGTRCGAQAGVSCGNILAGEHSVPETAIDSEYFVVAESRLESRLD